MCSSLSATPKKSKKLGLPASSRSTTRTSPFLFFCLIFLTTRLQTRLLPGFHWMGHSFSWKSTSPWRTHLTSIQSLKNQFYSNQNSKIYQSSSLRLATLRRLLRAGTSLSAIMSILRCRTKPQYPGSGFLGGWTSFPRQSSGRKQSSCLGRCSPLRMALTLPPFSDISPSYFSSSLLTSSSQLASRAMCLDWQPRMAPSTRRCPWSCYCRICSMIASVLSINN